MPLRDHFRPPLDDETQWEGFHGGWPMIIVAHLSRVLPRRYVAAPRVHSGVAVEIDVAAYEKDPSDPNGLSPEQGNGGITTAVWVPTRPTLAVETDLPDLAEYEVRVYDTRRGRRLVAAVEIVSPANKDRPEHRNAFIAKCLALLQNHVSIAIIDLVTTRNFNLYGQMLEALGQTDPTFSSEPPGLYAASCRLRRANKSGLLEAWASPLVLGQPLPTMPLWLTDDFAVPLYLEESYEETCRILRII